MADQESNNVYAGIGNKDTSSNNVSAAPTTIASTPAVIPQIQSLGDLNGGSYTFTDTAAVALSSYSYNSANDIHTFNVNTIGVASETYSIISGANFTGPKWRKPLTYADGSPVLAGDTFTLSVTIDQISPGLARQYLVCTSVIQSGGSTVLGTLRGSGVYCLTSSVGTPGIGGWGADNLGAVASVASMVRGVGTAAFSGGPTNTMYKSGVMMAAYSAAPGGSVNSRLDGGQWNIATTAQLSLGIFLSTNGTVTTTAGAFSMRIKYIVSKLS
jgi:hypothetical protein